MRGRLVHDEDVAVVGLDHDPGEHDLGPLPSGEGRHRTVHEVGGEADLLQGGDLVALVVHVGLGELGLEGGVLLGQRVPVDVAAGHHLLLDLRDPALDVLDVAVGPAENVADGDVGGVLGELLEVPYPLGVAGELAGIRLHLAQHDLEKSRLARPVHPDEADAVPLVDLEADILQDLVWSERLRDGLGFYEHGLGHGFIVDIISS